jgi:hypothetical protein
MRMRVILGLLLGVVGVLSVSLRADEPPAVVAPPAAAQPAAKRPNAPRRLLPPAIDAEKAGAEAIKQFDANHDGKLSGDELDKCPGVKAALAEIDSAGKGEVTAAMITARIKAWQATKLGRMSVFCKVTHNGKPLEGAIVKFVPEKFLGPNMQPAIGKTDGHGLAMISVKTVGPRDPPGVGPGLYRVEITKPGEAIPAEYNTATIFGQEVAQDAKGIKDMTGIKFDLDYVSPGE